MAVGVFMIATLAAVASVAGVAVQGDTTCPRPGEVAAALEGLVGAGSPDAPADVARLALEDTEVTISLGRAPRPGAPSDDPPRSKRIPQGLSCAERAMAAAIIIAAWEARLVVPPAAPLTGPSAESREPIPVVIARPRSAAARDGADVVDLGLSAGALLSVNGAGLAGAALIEGIRARRSSPYALSAGVLLVDAHAFSLGGGEATWRRFGLTAQVQRRFAWSTPWLEARAGAVLSVLRIAGQQYLANQDSTTFDPGLTAGLRAGLYTRWSSPWFQVGAAFWPRGQTVYSTGLEGRQQLPRFELLAGVGASVGHAGGR